MTCKQMMQEIFLYVVGLDSSNQRREIRCCGAPSHETHSALFTTRRGPLLFNTSTNRGETYLAFTRCSLTMPPPPSSSVPYSFGARGHLISVCAAPVWVAVVLTRPRRLSEDAFRSIITMVSALASLRLVLALVLVLALLHSAEGGCSSSEIECKTGGCISKGYICDGSRHCSDGSDEDDTICKFWPAKDNRCRRHSIETRFYYEGSCYNVYHMCQDSRGSKTLDSRICQIVNQPKLEPQQEGMNMTNEVVALLSSAVNSTLDQRKPDCPMLYTRVGNECLSFFSPAKVSWPEARHFCRSIYGDLWHFTDLASYGHLMAFMREEQFTSNYWIGGRYDLDTNAWSWVTDDSVMPLGAPYWTLKRADSCVRRGPPHTDPFSDPPAALPGARCYYNVMSPRKRSSGWCAAMTYENYYFWSDETCEESFSPLCIFTKPAATQEADNN